MSPFQSHDSFLWPGMEGLLPPQGVQGFTSEPHGIRVQYTEPGPAQTVLLGHEKAGKSFREGPASPALQNQLGISQWGWIDPSQRR